MMSYNYPTIAETLYVNQLPNGMMVYLIPKKHFMETTGVLTSRFGSLDNKFTAMGQAYQYPEGVAHFLEHKLFELSEGLDAATEFTKLGAESNAYTTVDKTSFYFSTTGNLSESLALLQEFVMSTHLTEESVDREKEIIGQEIEMYQDDADFRLYQGILENLFPKTALAEDIAGSRNSVNQISVKDLEENHQFFYHPSNMELVLVGDFKPEQIIEEIKVQQNKAEQRDFLPLERQAIVYHSVIKNRSMHMDVSLPKLAVGYRGPKPEGGRSLLEQKLSLQLFFTMLLGWTSETNQAWYDSRQIDDSFDLEIEVKEEYQYLIISLDTIEPIAMGTRLKQFLTHFERSKDLTEAHFQLLKRELYGDFLRSLDSVEHLAMQFVTYHLGEETYFDVPKLIEQLTLEQVVAVGREFLASADVTDFTIFPK